MRDLPAVDHEEGWGGWNHSFSRCASDVLERGEPFLNCFHLPLLQVTPSWPQVSLGRGSFAFPFAPLASGYTKVNLGANLTNWQENLFQAVLDKLGILGYFTPREISANNRVLSFFPRKL